MNLEQMRADFLDPHKGFVHLQSFVSREEVVGFREECAASLAILPRYEARINTDGMLDYVHPRSHDAMERTYRIYKFFHNNHSQDTTAFFDKILNLRNSLESEWMGDDLYRRECNRLQNYVIVTKYVPGTGMLPRHADYEGPAPFPLLQCLVLLSVPNEDFKGGEFDLYSKAGDIFRFGKDIEIQLGDVLFFDKSLDHSVDQTLPGDGSNLGRWSVLIGARATRDTFTKSIYKKFRHGPLTQPLRRLLGR